MYKKNKQGFTLVELIVVITILAILGTIGFISLQGYSKDARNSTRIADLNSVSKVMELYRLKNNQYPSPDASTPVLDGSGTLLWNTGIIGIQVQQNLQRLSKIPKDPADSSIGMKYSVTTNQKEYQLKYDLEFAQENLGIEKTYADTYIPKIKGNYNGLFLLDIVGDYRAVPSLFIDGTTVTGSTVFYVEGKSIGFDSVILKNGETNITPLNISMNYKEFVLALKVAYSGSIDLNTGIYIQLKNINENSDSQLISFGELLYSGNTSTLIVNDTSVSGSCNGLPAGGIYYGSTGSYNIIDAPEGTLLTSVYSVNPTENTCEFSCDTNYTWNGSSCNLNQSNPSNLVLSHTSRNKNFTFSWTGGIGNGGSCKLQYFKNGSTWTNISETTYNCDTIVSNQSVSLPGDGWNSTWSSIQVRVIRTSDSQNMGTFSQYLTCSSISGNSSSTPIIDEDCNGVWDNSSGYSGQCYYVATLRRVTSCSGNPNCTENSCGDGTASALTSGGIYSTSNYNGAVLGSGAWGTRACGASLNVDMWYSWTTAGTSCHTTLYY